MMAQAEVSPDAMLGMLDRLETLVDPFCAPLGSPERRAAEYLTELLSHMDDKTAEGSLICSTRMADRCNAS
jgi:hypothetical protein